MDPVMGERKPGAASARSSLAVTAWTLVVLLVLSGLTTGAIEDSGPGAMVIWNRLAGPIMALFGLSAVGSWAAAVWHASVDPKRHAAPRWLIVAVLVLGNFPGALLYYFLYVIWSKPARQPQDAGA